MKKYLFFSLLLTSCVASEPFPYRCTQINDNSLKNYNISKGDYLCFSEDVIDKAHFLNYSTDEFTEFTDYAVINKKLFETSNRGRFGGDYFADKAGDKISVDKTIHVINTKTFNDYDGYKRRKDRESIEQKELQAKIAMVKEKSGCKNIFKLDAFYKIFQQTDDGTLIVRAYGNMNMGNDIYFVTKNNTDSNRVDDEYVSNGYFEEIGTFKYTTTLGAVKTVKKIKRCSTEEF